MSACSSCGAPIVWATTEAGKAIPLSAATKQARVVVEEGPDGKLYATVKTTYLSHFVDCANAARHRKPRTP